MVVALFGSAMAGEYAWRTHQARVTPTGDIEWAPEAFRIQVAGNVRYIDYENGDDAKDGASKATAWQHHPWDRFATGNAAKHSGPTTYVFRRGVIYRGELVADESGRPERPIRLTASALDRNSTYYWGDGQAGLYGSVRLPGKWVKATTVQRPDRLPEPGKVWAIDLASLGLTVTEGDKKGSIALRHATKHWMDNKAIAEPWLGLHRIDGEGVSHTLHLARTPDWQPGNPNFALDYWHEMDEGSYTYKGKQRKGAVDAWLKGHPEDYFLGGYLWQQYGSFMGGATPKRIEKETRRGGPMYVPEVGAISGGLGIGPLKGGLRYMIDNLPQFLDSAGEFYHDKSTGTLFYRPADGVNPNDETLELTRYHNGLQVEDHNHIVLHGLTLRYYSDTGVRIEGDVRDILVKNCTFEDILNVGVAQGFGNWRVKKDPEYATDLRVHDCYFQDIWTTAITMGGTPHKRKVLDYIEIMRNRTLNTGIRHKDNVQTPLPAIELKFITTSHVAGNIVEDSWGSGIMLFSGTIGQGGGSQVEIPLNRHLVHENKTVDTALAVNDYGGMSLWMGGPIYCYNNNIGNSPGVMPAGITLFGGGGPNKATNLSYPLYLDGAYKVYSFNNIIWARSNDRSKDPFATGTPGYFMVFGFLNQFTNNTLYRTGEGVGGSSGHRNDVISNLMANVGGHPRKDAFIAHDRSGDPSLIGGGDDGSSGRRGVPTLAYANNVMHGRARAGRLLRGTAQHEAVEAVEVDELAKKMQAYPIRFGELGWETETLPIGGKDPDEPVIDGSDADFRPASGSLAVDRGATYFVPWNLYATVGEWHFTENRAEPSRQIDYAWYNTMAHFERGFYEFIPPLDLVFNELTLDGYADSPLEDWAKGMVAFDGKRFARVLDADMRKDVVIPIYTENKRGEKVMIRDLPEEQWVVPEPITGSLDNHRKAKFADDAVIRYPGELRHTLRVRDENVLLEAAFQAERGLTDAGLMGKFDGKSGYRLIINDAGRAEFQLASGAKTARVVSGLAVNDGAYYHVIAEADRKTGRMTIYVNGKKAGETDDAPLSETSLDNRADFLVGKTHDGRFFRGKIDTMRVAKGTLAQARTDIDELYAWFTDGPWRRDMLGRKPVGRRDAGAIEYGK
jgi:hypothetical protein